jgi:ribulose-bisphosphate carboxylase large chain
MKFDSIPFMAKQYGSDAVFLCGGALLSHGKSLTDSTAALLARVREHFHERLAEPQRDLPSSCDMAPNAAGSVVEHLPHQPDFTWKGRQATPYKSSSELAFKDVTRHELLGPFGEKAAFDLRYFEIAPGGFSSLEKHVHTHAIIAARGRGVLLVDGKRYDLKPLDIAHVPPLRVHQLRNEADGPFGFFCIVDHERDRPRAP